MHQSRALRGTGRPIQSLMSDKHQRMSRILVQEFKIYDTIYSTCHSLVHELQTHDKQNILKHKFGLCLHTISN